IALSMVLVVMTTAIIIAQTRLLGGRSYVTVSGKAAARRVVELGAWRVPVLALILLYFAVRLVIPLAMLIVGALQRTTIDIRPDAFTAEHLKVLLVPEVWDALKNTLAVGLVAATGGMLLTALISYIVIRTRVGLRHLLDGFTWVPYMVPSFV